MLKELEETKQLGKEFEKKIKILAMPFRFSIMVLVSNRRVQIFEKQIIELMDFLIQEEWTQEN